MSDQDKERAELFRQLELGLDVKSFIASNVGQYLIGRAEAERDEALKALKDVDPEDSKAIRALQFTVKRAESVQIWMAEAIQDSINAENALLERDQPDA